MEILLKYNIDIFCNITTVSGGEIGEAKLINNKCFSDVMASSKLLQNELWGYEQLITATYLFASSIFSICEKYYSATDTAASLISWLTNGNLIPRILHIINYKVSPI